MTQRRVLIFFPGGTRKSFELIFNFTPLRVSLALMDEPAHVEIPWRLRTGISRWLLRDDLLL